ncbi:MAG: ABC transporter substrate-binding protein, partial [Burkholderiaceae bacterium]|nr:ABC transporter substrate-binding protein [Burkholderiaceae bacterium]
MKIVRLLGAAAAAALSFTGMQSGIAQTPLRIGVLTDMSSINAHMGGPGAVTAVRMAIEDAGGSVLGRPIEVVSADHQGKPEVAASIARKWYESDGVEVITDLTNSAVAIAVQNVGKSLGKITL